MVRVESYLKVGEEFVPVEEYQGPVSNPLYIDGAITLEVNGVKVMTLKMWDLVDQLWAYVAQGLVQLTIEQSWSTYFPDQPLELLLRTDQHRRHVVVEIEGVKASADYNEFMTVMSEAGQCFFRKIVELVPENSSMYEKQLTRLETVMPYAKQH